MRFSERFRYFDKWLFAAPLIIFAIGVLSVFSASFKLQQPLEESLALKQMMWMGLGIVLMFLLVRISYFRLQDLAVPLYVLSLVLLVVVFFMPARLGAHRWIGFRSFNIQPSELAKFSVILLLSYYFSSRRYEHCGRLQRLLPFILVGIPFLLILKEPDLGTGLLLIPVFLSMFYLWGASGRTILMMLASGFVATPLAFHFLKDYQKARLLVFINPNADPLGAGYTIIQSKISIGSGGLFGKGFMGGTQNQLRFLPERHTDFIFGVLAEEGGFIAGMIVIALFCFIVYRGYKICLETSDRFGSQLACGATTLLGMQAIINLGMTMGMLPVVGVPLPLVSYGGTSIVVTMLLIGLLINIKIYKNL